MPGSSTTHVLVVDDDQDIRSAWASALDDEGYATQTASDGAAAVEKLRASPDPVIVLLDLMMPKLDGAGVLAAALEDPLLRRHKYILATANFGKFTPDLAEARAHLGVPLLAKPTDIDDMLAAIESAESRLQAQP